MKFSVQSGELLSRLQTMGKVVDDKAALPVLANFLFTIKGNLLILTAANAEMRMTSSLEINNMEGDGKICIPGIKLTEYIKYLPEQPVTFSIPDGSLALEISSLSGKSDQVCVAAEDYPEEKIDEQDIRSVKISEDALLSGISSTIFATANDDLHPVMNGIYFDIEPGKVSFVATDSHKMARYIRTDVETGDQTASFVLNKKPANVLKGILGRSEDMVNVSFGSRNVIFETPTYRYICRLTEGQYPQYRSVIPANNESKILVNRTDLIKAMARVSVFVDASRLIKCELFSNSMNISTQDLDFSCSANESLPCEYEGKEMVVGFGGQHLGDALNNIASQDVEIRLSDPSKPGLISPVGADDKSDMLIVIMPMRI